MLHLASSSEAINSVALLNSSTTETCETSIIDSAQSVEKSIEVDQSYDIINLFGVSHRVVEEFNGFKTIEVLSSFLPVMENVLYKQLKENIRKNGVIDPILYYTLEDGTKLVIEGHTRLRAAIETRKKEVPTKEIQENFKSIADIKFWMVKQQFQRRNLSNVEKLKLAYLSKDVIVQQAKQNIKKGGAGKAIDKPIDTDFEIAKIAGISKSSVSRYTKVMKYGSESLIKKMQNGEISIKQAANKAKESDVSDVSIEKIKQLAKHEPNEPRIVDSIQVGQYLLSKAEVQALIIINNPDDVKLFSNSLLAKIGFVILN